MASEPVTTITHRLLGYVVLLLVVVLLCWIACSETFGESALTKGRWPEFGGLGLCISNTAPFVLDIVGLIHAKEGCTNN